MEAASLTAAVRRWRRPEHRPEHRPDRPTMLVVRNDHQPAISDSLTAAAAAAGWDVTGDEGRETDVAVAFDVPRDVHRFGQQDMPVAVVAQHEEAWARSGALDAARLVLAPDRTTSARIAAVWADGIARIHDGPLHDGTQLFDDLLQRRSLATEARRIGVSSSARTVAQAAFWGDTHFGRGLMRALRRLGHDTAEVIKPDWGSERASSCDTIIHLRGLARRPVDRSQRNVLWIISHPDNVQPDEYDEYDILVSASRDHAERLSADLGRTVHFLPQAADVDTFRIGPRDVRFEADVLYVGGARWPARRAPRWLLLSGRPFHLYGNNWDGFPEARLVRGEFIPNRDLAAAYRSASVVVADHHGSMRTDGFVANRLFDVLAAGGVVLSDDVAGLDELLGDTVPTYSDPQELECQLEILLDDDVRRRRLAIEGREIVRLRHTLDHRAAALVELLDAN